MHKLLPEILKALVKWRSFRMTLPVGRSESHHLATTVELKNLRTHPAHACKDDKKLYTGLVYLNPPRGEVLIHYPRRAKLLLSCISPKIMGFTSCWLSYFARLFEEYFQSQLSLCGWGVLSSIGILDMLRFYL